jgi:dTDP-glucose 4,6-dehydratase
MPSQSYKEHIMKYIRFAIFLVLLISHHTSLQAQENIPKEDQKTVLITGAAGFIGSNFLKYMFDKYTHYHFIVIDALTYAGSLEKIPTYIQNSPRFEFIHDTITNEKVVNVAMAKSQLVVHFAAETHVTRSIQNDALFFYTDVIGTRVLMNAVVKHAKNVERFIHISTSEVYGTAEYIPMNEAHPLDARSPYAAAKVGADRLVYSYCCTFNVPAVIIRPFNNYGPGQHLEKLIPRLVTLAIKGEPLTIHGSGEQKRDWIHTSDMAKAIDSALHTKDFASIKHQVINVGSGIATSVLDIAKIILKEFNLSESHLQFVVDRPGQVDIHLSATEKAKTLLNWTATIPLEEGIHQTIEWYKKYPEIWEKMEKDALVPITTADGEIIFH